MCNDMTIAPKLIVMLTRNDLTVSNAAEIFAQCKDSRADYWGMKEQPLPIPEMERLFAYMKSCGKSTFLEVVATTEEEGLRGAETAHRCGCDYLLGTIYSDAVNDYCKSHNIKYMPFVGKVYGRPSVLEGTVEEMVAEAKDYIARGVYGIDLLGYRFTGDVLRLNRELISRVKAPVCLAGSIDSFARLDEVKKVAPWSFTIGSAFFNNRFLPATSLSPQSSSPASSSLSASPAQSPQSSPSAQSLSLSSFSSQIDAVCDYMSR